MILTKKLFYIQLKKDEAVKTAVNLSEIKKCRIENTVYENAKGKLELVLINTHPEKMPVAIEFYDTKVAAFTLGPELQLIEKWVSIVDDIILHK